MSEKAKSVLRQMLVPVLSGVIISYVAFIGGYIWQAKVKADSQIDQLTTIKIELHNRMRFLRKQEEFLEILNPERYKAFLDEFRTPDRIVGFIPKLSDVSTSSLLVQLDIYTGLTEDGSLTDSIVVLRHSLAEFYYENSEMENVGKINKFINGVILEYERVHDLPMKSVPKDAAMLK